MTRTQQARRLYKSAMSAKAHGRIHTYREKLDQARALLALPSPTQKSLLRRWGKNPRRQAGSLGLALLLSNLDWLFRRLV